jgi:hypothetical protein
MSSKKEPHTYDKLSEYMQFIVDAFAGYYTASEIAQAVREQFTDDEGKPRIVNPSTLRTYQIRHADIIKARREELAMSDIPILDPMIRFKWLQETIEEAKNGTPFITKAGEVVMVKKLDTVLKGIDLANKMTNHYKDAAKPDAPDERAEKKRLVEELRTELKKVDPTATDDTINAVILTQLGPEAKEYLN